MKDKEKQIEEMARTVCCFPNVRCFYETCKKCNQSSECKIYKDCKELYEQGYRKIPKDSVVLSREEYEKKKKHLQDVLELSNAQYEKVLEENKRLERLLNLIDDLPKENLLDVDKAIETIKQKARKETAEKILKFLDDYCDCDSAYLVEQAKEYVAKQFGVEIKE